VPERGYTCSVGVVEAVWAETTEAVLQRADEALFRAKAGGRNQLSHGD
jgi:PleD family two-component response regulator